MRHDAASGDRIVGVIAVIAALAAASSVTACDRLPLLAPTGSVITLFATANVLSANGTTDIVATVIEQGTASSGGGEGTTPTSSPGAGTPVHNGTLVTFTTTLGSIEPREARTHNGQVTVKFRADGRSGTAKVTAFSGGTSGSLELVVGTAAVERILLTAVPQTVAPTGGSVDLTARAEDASGNGLSAVPVSFTTTAGSVQPPIATTDGEGIARARLTTAATATVTASAGSAQATADITLAARTGITISVSSVSSTAGQPVTFNVSVSNLANVRNVVVDFGDSARTSLGMLTGSTSVSHVYAREGTYTVRATATDATGYQETVATVVTVLPAGPVNVTLSATQSPSVNVPVTFTAVVSGSGTIQVARYDWSFGDGSSATTTGNVISHVYTAPGVKTVSVTVTTTDGRTGTSQIQISVL